MKRILLALTLMLSITAFSQNGGQLNENPSVKMEFVSIINGVTTLKITNKQNCEAEIQTKTSTLTRVKVYSGLSSDTLQFTGLVGTNVKIQSKALTNCGTTDYGNVELTLNINDLPVRIVAIRVKLIYKD